MLNVQGQARAVGQLQRALANGRLASTWMFAGPAGVGKFTLAMAFARTVLCDRPQRQANGKSVAGLLADVQLTLPCGSCESCRAVDAGNHPDVHIITKELIRIHDREGKSKGTTMSIQVIRGEITGDPAENKEPKIGRRSFRGRGKFFIIDEADLMEGPAQNALLKVLEEPPPQTYMVLLTASPQELLWTIRSRSQLVEFAALPDEVVVRGARQAGLSADDAALMARLAGGSLGRALRWMEDARTIEEKNTAAAERQAKKAERSGGESDEEEAAKFTAGGVLAWTRNLAAALDGLVAGRAAASDVAAIMTQYAAEYAALRLIRDKLTSADQAKRDGIALLMGIAAEWFADRMRHGLGTPRGTRLPGETAALDYGMVPELIASARAAEAQIDMNANDKILLAATTTQWELLLRK